MSKSFTTIPAALGAQHVSGQVPARLNGEHTVLDSPRQHVGPLVNGLVGDIQCLSGGTNRAPEKVDRFSFGHRLHGPDLTIVKPHGSNRPCEHATVVANTYSDRLELAMTEAKKSISDLAAAMGISYQAVRKAVKGESNAFSAENNAKAARFLGVRPDWLATGEQPMHETPSATHGELSQRSIRQALTALRNQLAHGVGPQNEVAGAALALLAKVPDSERAFEDAFIAMMAVAALPPGDPAVTAFVEPLFSPRATALAKRFDELGHVGLQAKVYAQLAQLFEQIEAEKAANQTRSTTPPPAGQSQSPAGAR